MKEYLKRIGDWFYKAAGWDESMVLLATVIMAFSIWVTKQVDPILSGVWGGIVVSNFGARVYQKFLQAKNNVS